MSNSHYYRLTRYVCQSALLNTLSDNFRLKKLKNGTKYNLNSNSKLEAFSNQTLVCVPFTFDVRGISGGGVKNGQNMPTSFMHGP